MADVFDTILGAVAGDEAAFGAPEPPPEPKRAEPQAQAEPETTEKVDPPSDDIFEGLDIGADTPSYYGVPLDQIYGGEGVEDRPAVPDPGDPESEPEQTAQQAAVEQNQDAAREAVQNYEGDDPQILKLKAELAQLKSMVPIMEHINRDPRLAAQVFDVIDKAATPQPEANPLPAKPEAPERPPDYNPELAYQDPSSSSWRYREEMERHRFELADWRASVAETRAERLEKALSADRERQAQEREMLASRNQFRQQALARGATPEQAEKYVQFMENPNVSDDQIWRLFTLVEGGAFEQPKKSGTVQPSGTKTKNPVAERAQRLNYPNPSGQSAPASGASKGVHDTVFDQLLGYAKGQNPFPEL